MGWRYVGKGHHIYFFDLGRVTLLLFIICWGGSPDLKKKTFLPYRQFPIHYKSEKQRFAHFWKKVLFRKKVNFFKKKFKTLKKKLKKKMKELKKWGPWNKRTNKLQLEKRKTMYFFFQKFCSLNFFNFFLVYICNLSLDFTRSAQKTDMEKGEPVCKTLN